MDLTSIQLMQGASGASGETTYVDDVFSTYLYQGNANDNTTTEQPINNGIDLAGEGGLVWLKHRTGLLGSAPHLFIDTERGVRNTIESNNNGAQVQGAASNAGGTGSGLHTFNSNGFTLKGQGKQGGANYGQGGTATYSSWAFRKAKGFFDVVTYTGTGSTRTVAHNLGCIPGLIIIKCTSNAESWIVYHRDVGAEKYLLLNSTDAVGTSSSAWNNTAPTSTHFTVSTAGQSNDNGYTYVAYVFAGGESTAATAKSVDYDGSGDYLSTGSSSDFTMGTGDFTIECWVKFQDTANRGIFQISDDAGGLSSAGGGGAGGSIAFSHNGSQWHVYGAGAAQNAAYSRSTNQWYHIAYTRSSGVSRCFVDGIQTHEFADTHNYNGTYVVVGGYYSTNYLMQGEISNFRIIKGTALYTGGFRPSNKPLESITNTKLLCCNNSSVTGSTTNSSGSLTSNGNPTASTENPFADSAGFVFGEGRDQPIIKCGMYEGYGSERYIDVGFEPQWILAKNIDDSSGKNWIIIDAMRGASDITNNLDSRGLFPNINQNETSGNYIGMKSKGFKLLAGESSSNKSGDRYIYMAIRRSDGYVGKPAALGTDVFNTIYGTSSANPTFVSGFPVDFAFQRKTNQSQDWYTGARILGNRNMRFNTQAAEDSSQSSNTWRWYFSNGWHEYSADQTANQSWMWKRHAGFDIVNWTGNGRVTEHVHNLGRAPEFFMVKRRSSTEDWTCYHKGFNGGTNPSYYWIQLNATSGESTYTNYEPGNPGNYNLWNREEPTSTHITIGEHDRVNTSSETYTALLFASVEGISKVGSFTGSNSMVSVNLGFQPRFLILRRGNGTGNWVTLDTVRGWGAGDDQYMRLNSTGQSSAHDVGAPTSTGFDVTGGSSDYNAAGSTYIYYAHA